MDGVENGKMEGAEGGEGRELEKIFLSKKIHLGFHFAFYAVLLLPIYMFLSPEWWDYSRIEFSEE